jgi:hypothetical protein
MNNLEKIPVEDRPDLVRDSYSKAILSSDVQKLHEHRRKVAMMKSLINNTNEIEQLKQDISEIKGLLVELVKQKR